MRKLSIILLTFLLAMPFIIIIFLSVNQDLNLNPFYKPPCACGGNLEEPEKVEIENR